MTHLHNAALLLFASSFTESSTRTFVNTFVMGFHVILMPASGLLDRVRNSILDIPITTVILILSMIVLFLVELRWIVLNVRLFIVILRYSRQRRYKIV